MKLSTVAYECVRNSILMPAPNLDYETFCELISDDTENVGRRFALQLSGVWPALNLALSRLMNADKIPFIVEQVYIVDNAGPYDSDGEIIEIDGDIINIVSINDDGSYTNLPYRTYSVMEDNQRVAMFSLLSANYSSAVVEYRQRLPRFEASDIVALDTDDDGSVVDDNIDLLSQYGITNQMCDYIIEFVKGQIMEPFAPEVANVHNNRAEQYLTLLPDAKTAFYQSNVADVMAKEIL